MSAAETAPATLDRIRRHLVGLKMPRALEVLEHTVRQLERGEISALEALDTVARSPPWRHSIPCSVRS